MSDLWAVLQNHHKSIAGRRILSLFDDPRRFEGFSATADDLTLDYSKTNIDETARKHLINLATDCGVQEKRDAMFRGEKINSTEDRAVLHTALRAKVGAPILVDGQDVMPGISAVRTRMEVFSYAVRDGEISAIDGMPFTDVVNIGIGGSDLGPAMATLALAPYHDGPNTYFVSNVDGADITDTLKGLDARRTLVIIASKTFTTIETMTNAAAAINWLRADLGDSFGQHLAAVSSATDKTKALGIDPDRVFGFEDWVGGRYSLWGPVGLPIMLAVGPDRFAQFLDGAYALDQHFQTAPLDENLPVLLALVGIWHNNICGCSTRAVLPYDQRLARFPAYLQQLDMESNGKSVSHDGRPLARNSGPVVWGEPGTNGQHAFYQLLHQGNVVVPTEFLIAACGHEPELAAQHDLLKANCLAQSEALMIGRSADQAQKLAAALGYSGAELDQQAAHRTFAGNRPSITLAYPKLTPFVLGQLIALYEHRVFVEAAIWGINAFDQWGVELGKELAVDLLANIKGTPLTGGNGSTAGLIRVLSQK